MPHLHLFPKYLEAQQRRLNRNTNDRPPEIIWDENLEKHLCILDTDDAFANQQEVEDDDDDGDEGNLTLLKTFPFVLDHLEKALGRGLTVKRAKGLFDFAKGGECEMELGENDHVLLVESQESGGDQNKEGGSASGKDPKSIDRFASIEELDSPKTPQDVAAKKLAVKTASYLTVNPEASEFVEHLQEFLRMQSEYGSGWVVAVKMSVRDVGGSGLKEGHEALNGERVPRVVHRFSMRLLDIGLVPQSYVS
ncbi:UNVERIFIED_CONTAM: hypothetical protein HDU68_002440 [Siphonaria sp. JEL0065]|nr:hypothetical protein HDU68_002440 [Siphonaria sp. JEL0065]